MTNSDPFGELLGSSPSFEEMKERARQFLARVKAGGRLPPVLIQGETGSGKGLLARSLHNARPQTPGRFLAVNCGAIPETLGESEFFGFARGAHSEARHARVGLFQAAHRGTIFLDEVGLLSEGHQARLLKVIEDREVTPVGSTTPVPVDVWVISATNADLWADVQAQKFRRDLYERLAVITFKLPPLRERPGDIVSLAEGFLARACSEYGLRTKQLAPDARRRLLDHSWPGNVRELMNVIERAALLVETDTLPAACLELDSPAVVAVAAPAARSVGRADRRERILGALERQGRNITRAAADLGVTRKTLRDWMRQSGLYQSPGLRAVPATGSGPAAESHEKWDHRRIALIRVELGDPTSSGATPGEWSNQIKVVIDKVDSFGGMVREISVDGLEASFGLLPMEDPPDGPPTPRSQSAASCCVTASSRTTRPTGSGSIRVKCSSRMLATRLESTADRCARCSL